MVGKNLADPNHVHDTVHAHFERKCFAATRTAMSKQYQAWCFQALAYEHASARTRIDRPLKRQSGDLLRKLSGVLQGGGCAVEGGSVPQRGPIPNAPASAR